MKVTRIPAPQPPPDEIQIVLSELDAAALTSALLDFETGSREYTLGESILSRIESSELRRRIACGRVVPSSAIGRPRVKLIEF